MPTKTSSYHVVRNPSEGWSVKKAGAHRASGTFSTQKEAVDHASRVASGKNADVIVHGRDGRISRSVFRSHSVGGTVRGPGIEWYSLTKKGDEWRMEKDGSNRPVVSAGTKTEAMQKMSGYLRSRGGSVRILKRDGKVQEERTYPRSKDPMRSKR